MKNLHPGLGAQSTIEAEDPTAAPRCVGWCLIGKAGCRRRCKGCGECTCGTRRRHRWTIGRSSEEENCSEEAAARRPEGLRWDDTPDKEWRTWYAGGREKVWRADGVEEWRGHAGSRGEGKEAGVELGG